MDRNSSKLAFQKPKMMKTWMDFSPQQLNRVANLEEVQAVSALMYEGGHDLVLATIMMEVTDFGWALWEMDLRELNDEEELQETLPSWIISTIRHQLRTELVLCNYGMVPRHGQLIGQAMNHSERLQRLVLHHNAISDEGVVDIARSLSDNSSLHTLHLVGADITDEGATFLAAALESNNTLTFLHLANNCITPAGVATLAKSLQSNTKLNELVLSDNKLRGASEASCSTQLAAAGFQHRGDHLYIRPLSGVATAEPVAPHRDRFKWKIEAKPSPLKKKKSVDEEVDVGEPLRDLTRPKKNSKKKNVSSKKNFPWNLFS